MCKRSHMLINPHRLIYVFLSVCGAFQPLLVHCFGFTAHSFNDTAHISRQLSNTHCNLRIEITALSTEPQCSFFITGWKLLGYIRNQHQKSIRQGSIRSPITLTLKDAWTRLTRTKITHIATDLHYQHYMHPVSGLCVLSA